MRIVVATVVHHPDDARIRHRQIPALLDDGWQVTYIAPDGDTAPSPAGLTRVVVPAARGRRRLGSLRAARRALREHTRGADLTVIHDPELLMLTRSVRSPLVWDIHEDVAAQVVEKEWVPRRLRGAVARVAGRAERRGRRLPRTIAEEGYRARHPDAVLVRNTVRFPETVPPPGDDRAVYLGRVSYGRGAASLAELRRVLDDDIMLDVIGPLDENVVELFASAGRHRARGFLPNDVALREVEGALVGLALLRDLPNYRHSMPTKILEYLAHGVPVVTTPLPAAVEIMQRFDCGLIVPFDDPQATADAVHRLRDDPDLRQRLAANGRKAVAEHYRWADDAARMLDFYRTIAGDRPD